MPSAYREQVTETRAEVAAIEHRHLRSAIEFGLAIAEAGQKLRPPLTFPAELKPFLKQARVPSSALGRLRRTIEADEGFRRRLGAGAVPELVDPVGMEWLRREDGWQERIVELVATADRATADADAAAVLRRAEKRRDAAEQAAARTRAELVQLQERLDEATTQLDTRRASIKETASDRESMRSQLAESRLAVRHANDRAHAARGKLSGLQAERDAALRRAADAEIQRDALLAARAEGAGVSMAATQVSELRELSRSARSLAERMSALVDVGTVTRRALALPGGVARDSRRATEYLLRSPGVLVLVDGYNVAKLVWPELELVGQRERCLDAVDDIARRYGSDLTVVFDGADVVGSHAARRRLARVTYSPAGVTADDVIRVEVAGAPVERNVVVVTNDQAIRRDVGADGANLIASDAFVELACC